jgi:hypothetical protein
MSLSNWIRSWFGIHFDEYIKTSDKLHRLPEGYWRKYKEFIDSIKDSYTYNSKYALKDIPNFKTINSDLYQVLDSINTKFIYKKDGEIDN